MSTNLVFTIVCGLIYLDEWSAYDGLNLLGIMFGILMCNGGIALITLKNAKVAKKNILRTKT